MVSEFYSHGKLLLSGEYAVLDGALAWAIPTKYGQYLRFRTNNSKNLLWRSLDEKGEVWFEGLYHIANLEEISSSDQDISKVLQNILLQAKQLNTNFLAACKGLVVETKLDFPRDWGLGSSSTLINNIAQWAQINAHILLENTFGGSGYDISCAKQNTPILYQLKNKKPIVHPVTQTPSFADSLYFIYLNKKKNSREGIAAYRKQKIDSLHIVKTLSELTKNMVACNNLIDFKKLMTSHEELLSAVLGIPSIQSELFSDFNGAVKSLGAWGGDFVLAAGDKQTCGYFNKKGYSIVIPFKKMML